VRGVIQNKKREISEERAYHFLKMGKVAHVATMGDDGYPYVIPFVYVYEQGNKLYLHTGNLRESHFRTNIDTEVFEVQIDKITGKLSEGLRH
jgi:nitroimidazol reductase NimA-like FMN-containing flavoprotein (pyridoxamine 5'-phosphate oxidase superfamily)